MTPHDMIELILNKDHKTEEYIADKLIKEIHRQPALLNHKFILERTIFHLLAIENLSVVIEKLLNDPMIRVAAFNSDRLGNTLIHYGSRAGSSGKVLKLLIEKLPELVNKKNDQEHTPIHTTIIQNQTWALSYLIQSEETVYNLDKKGNTLLHQAVSHESLPEILELLIEHLPEELINKKNNKGETALHIAVKLKQINTILLLVQSKKADITIENDEGLTAFDLAKNDAENKNKLKKALLYIDLEHLHKTDIRIRGDISETSSSELRDTFPTLSSRNISSFSSRNLSSFSDETDGSSISSRDFEDETSASPRDMLRLYTLLQQFLPGSEAFNELKDQFRSYCSKIDLEQFGLLMERLSESKETGRAVYTLLIEQLLSLLQESTPGSRQFTKLKKQFVILCISLDLNSFDEFKEKIFESSGNHRLLYSLLNEIKPLVNQQHSEIQDAGIKILQQLTFKIRGQRLIHSSDPYIMPDLEKYNEGQPEDAIEKISDLMELIAEASSYQNNQMNTEQDERKNLAAEKILTLFEAVSNLTEGTENQETEEKILDIYRSLSLNTAMEVKEEAKEKEAVEKEKQTKVKEKKFNIFQIIWLITAGQDAPNAVRKIDLQKITHTAIGLQSRLSFKEILTTLIQLYPQFDSHQKLVAMYIACQLLIHNGLDSSAQTEINSSFHSFIEIISEVRKETRPSKGNLRNNKTTTSERLWSMRLTKLITLYEDYQPLQNNYRLLSSWHRSTSLNQNLKSFDQLVDNALIKASTEREMELRIIESEIRALSKYFYQTVAISEFYNSNWSDKEHPDLAPNIRLQTAHVDILIYYFIEKILDQPSENIVNGIKLIVQLAQAFCPLEDSSLLNDEYPDLTGLMIMLGVLKSASLSRLEPYLDELTLEEKNVIKEIDLVFKNKWMRCISYRSASLPFVGMILTDITLTIDGNCINLLNQMELLGKTYLEILKVKALVNFEISSHATDLPHFLNSKNNSKCHSKPTDDYEDEETARLYYKSHRIQPAEIDITDLTSHTKTDIMLFFDNFNILLDNLESKYLNNNILPSVKFEQNTYEPRYLAQHLFSVFNDQLKNSNRPLMLIELKKRINEPQETIDKLERTINKIVSVHNTFYYPNHSLEKLNPLVYLNQMAQLRQSLNKMEDKKEQRQSRSMIWAGKIPLFKSLAFHSPNPDAKDRALTPVKHKRSKSLSKEKTDTIEKHKEVIEQLSKARPEETTPILPTEKTPIEKRNNLGKMRAMTFKNHPKIKSSTSTEEVSIPPQHKGI